MNLNYLRCILPCFLFFLILFTTIPGYCEASSSQSLSVVLTLDRPTCVYDMTLASQKISNSEITNPVNTVFLRDFDGVEHIDGNTYVAKIFNEKNEFMSTIPLDLVTTIPKKKEGHLVADKPEKLTNMQPGAYYVFVYVITKSGEEDILPFACSVEETLSPRCSSGPGCLYTYGDKKTFSPYGKYRNYDNCSESWCCCCGCEYLIQRKKSNMFYVFSNYKEVENEEEIDYEIKYEDCSSDEFSLFQYIAGKLDVFWDEL